MQKRYSIFHDFFLNDNVFLELFNYDVLIDQ